MNYLKSHKVSQSESYTMIFKILQSSRKMRFWLDIQWNSTAQQYLRCQFQDIFLLLLIMRPSLKTGFALKFQILSESDRLCTPAG